MRPRRDEPVKREDLLVGEELVVVGAASHALVAQASRPKDRRGPDDPPRGQPQQQLEVLARLEGLVATQLGSAESPTEERR